jgi:hypothetical protein
MTSITLLSVVGAPLLPALESAAQPERAILVPRSEWQQGDVAGLLDGACQSPLVRGTHTSQAAGNNLAPLGNKLLQQAHIAVMNGVDLLHAELADLLAPEELAPTRATRSARPAWAAATWTAVATWTISCGTLWTVSRRTVRAIPGRTIAGWTLDCCARCRCYCAGFLSHGSFFFLPAP